MATPIRSRLTVAQGRRFGLTVGTALFAIAALGWWRGHVITATVLGVSAAGLLLAAIVVPTHLGPVERAWMKLALALSRVTTPIVTAVIYFGVLTPLALLRRVFAGSSLVHRESASGFWKTRPEGARRSKMERQF